LFFHHRWLFLEKQVFLEAKASTSLVFESDSKLWRIGAYSFVNTQLEKWLFHFS
jgi:hypothetical protein